MRVKLRSENATADGVLAFGGLLRNLRIDHRLHLFEVEHLLLFLCELVLGLEVDPLKFEEGEALFVHYKFI